ncbi:MAG: thioredoxin family protein [Phycisphaeraceae bacterium]|nr:thioredoxin family protein [Phycisphaeraceae bacterium]MCW5762928.1 thioredoxin family protein [Phycisphaeraceae bacterium]
MHSPITLSALSRPLRAALGLLVAMLALSLPAAPANSQPGFDPFGAAYGPVVEVEIVSAAPAARPGEPFALAVILDHIPGWHSHTHRPPPIPSFTAVATELAGLKGTGAAVGPIQWPASKTIKVDFTGDGPMDYPVYEGRAAIYVPLMPEAGASEIRLTFQLIYQACDDRLCEAPVFDDREIVIPIADQSDADAAAAPTWTGDFAAFDRTVFERSWEGANQPDARETAAGGSTFFGLTVPRGLIALVLLAIVGGFVLNLTPCVLPVIPLKVMALSKHAATPAKALSLGAAMAAGVVAFWIGVGLPVALFREAFGDPSALFGIWWVTLGIGLVIAAMGLGIMGLFEIRLPQAAYRVNASADSFGGSFVFGIMTAVLGLPCFGFVAGALLVGLATMPAFDIIAIFAGIGVGMAAPYLVLAARPQWVAKIPRTGPASTLVKQVMGLLLLAAAAYFAGAGVMALVKADPVRAASLPVAAKVASWWVIALLAAGAGLWLAVRTFAITKKPANRAAFSLVGLVIAATSVQFALGRTHKAMDDIWIPYSPENLAAARARGEVVVLDFTADWCLNCQVLKATVLDRQPVKGELAGSGVVPMIADLTSRNAPGWARLESLGQTGIPLLVIDGPGLASPWQANAYTPAQVMEAIAAARGR